MDKGVKHILIMHTFLIYFKSVSPGLDLRFLFGCLKKTTKNPKHLIHPRGQDVGFYYSEGFFIFHFEFLRNGKSCLKKCLLFEN